MWIIGTININSTWIINHWKALVAMNSFNIIRLSSIVVELYTIRYFIDQQWDCPFRKYVSHPSVLALSTISIPYIASSKLYAIYPKIEIEILIWVNALVIYSKNATIFLTLLYSLYATAYSCVWNYDELILLFFRFVFHSDFFPSSLHQRLFR